MDRLFAIAQIAGTLASKLLTDLDDIEANEDDCVDRAVAVSVQTAQMIVDEVLSQALND